MRALYFVLVVLVCERANGLILPHGVEFPRLRSAAAAKPWFPRMRRQSRPTHRVIDPNEECVLMTSEEGEIFFKSPSDEPKVCGIYMVAEPDKRIQLVFDYLDVPCENGGLVAWVDGWELNGQVWPADDWSDDRLVESCGQRPQRRLVSRQNAALVQYRVPARGKGFSITIRHVRNPWPCNVMLYGAEGVYTLRNHGEAKNCSIITVSPSIVKVVSLDVGQLVKAHSALELETGTIHRCTKRGLADYVVIGGASGLDNTKMEAYDSVCGLDSTEGRPIYVACENTIAQLVSTGRFFDSVTLAFSPLPLEELEHADLMCGLNDL